MNGNLEGGGSAEFNDGHAYQVGGSETGPCNL